MTDRNAPALPKWPFFVGDAMMLGMAWLVFWQGRLPLGQWEVVTGAACVAIGALLGVIPFVMEYRTATRLSEADRLNAAVLQIQNLEILGRQIANATANWQSAQETSAKTVESARAIGETVTGAMRTFADLLHRANDAEKNHLRLEVEKLRRVENDWLQVLVRVLDHVFGLYQAGVRSGQPHLVEQFAHFQNACRDAARRVGLVPFTAIAGEAFDPKIHQPADTKSEPSADSRVEETLATGYSFQGQLVRPALVSVQSPEKRKALNDSDLSVSAISRRRDQSPATAVVNPAAATVTIPNSSESVPPSTSKTALESVPTTVAAVDAAAESELPFE